MSVVSIGGRSVAAGSRSAARRPPRSDVEIPGQATLALGVLNDRWKPYLLPLMALAAWGAAYARERAGLEGGGGAPADARKGATRWG